MPICAIFALICVLLLTIKLSKRVGRYLYDHKIAGRFFPRQKNVVYIAYSEEEPEHARTLLKILENEWEHGNQKHLHGRIYEVLVHERDFPGGQPVVENIHNSIGDLSLIHI